MKGKNRKLAAMWTATAAALTMADTASAAPFIDVKLEGRLTGSGNPFSNTVAVANGQSVDYRATFTLAPVGTMNTNPAGTANDTINSYNASSPAFTSNGLNNIKVSLFQSLGEQIQVDFSSPTLDGNFDEPPGATTGAVTSRGNGNDDVIGVGSVTTAGVFLGIPTPNTPAQTLLFTGQFTVTSVGTGIDSLANVGIQGISGTMFGMKYNNTATYNGTTTQQIGAAPPVLFENLTLVLSESGGTWTLDANGNWSAAANWSSNPAVPNGVGDAARFLGAITANRTITQDVAGLTLGAIEFNENNRYTISGANAITLDASAGDAKVTVNTSNGTGLHTIATNLALNDTVQVTTNAGSAFPLTFSGVMSGTGGLVKSGIGTLVLSGATANSFSGDVTVNEGTLELFKSTPATVAIGGNLIIGDDIGGANADIAITKNGAIPDTSTVTINSSGQLQVPGGDFIDDLVMKGGSVTITGGGPALRVLGGLTTLAHANEATISGAGDFAIPVATTCVMNVADGAAANDLLISARITGASFDKQGLGKLVLTGPNAYSATTISAGTLQIGNGGTTGNLGTAAGASSNVTNNATLVFNRSDAMTVGNLISGTGAVIQIGPGTTILANSNSYTGGTTISAGTLQVGNGGTVGFLGPGPVTNNASLVFDRSNNSVFGGSISGTGSLTKTGAGILTLTGTNSYTGVTNINGGTISISAGNGLGTGAVTLANGSMLGATATFTLPQSVTLGAGGGKFHVDSGLNLSLSGFISGSGELTKFGNGTLIFSNGTGGNTFNGNTVVTAGTLRLSRPPGFVSINGGTITIGAGNDGTPAVYVIVDQSGAFGLGVGLAVNGNGQFDGGNQFTALTGGLTMSGGSIINAFLRIATNNVVTNASSQSATIAGTGLDFFGQNRTFTVADGFADDDLLISAPMGNGGIIKQGDGTLTLTAASTYSGGTAINAGTLSISSNGNLGSVAGGLTFDGGTLLTSAAVTSARNITVNAGGGTINTNGFDSTFGNVSGVGTLVKNTGKLTVNHVRTGGLTINAGTVAIATNGGAAGTSRVSTLTIAEGAKLDLNNNDLIIDGGNYDDIEADVIEGFNAGDWLGNGISSSAAANDTVGVSALGIINNAEFGYSEFSGQTGLNSDEILVKYTYYGDADVGGTVNNDDFVQFLAGYNEGATAKWLNGDFDYNASVNLDDFALFLAGLQDQDDPRVSPELFANLSEFVAAEGVDVDLSAIPEPGSAALLALATTLLSRRRSRR